MNSTGACPEARRWRGFACMLAVAACSACMTFDTRSNADYRGPSVYSGSRADLSYLGQSLLHLSLGTFGLALIDLPLSFVADTLLLPVTIPEDLGREAQHTRSVDPALEQPSPIADFAGDDPVDAARALLDECLDRLRQQRADFVDCYSVDARIERFEAGGRLELQDGAQWKARMRPRLERMVRTGEYVTLLDAEFTREIDAVRVDVEVASSLRPDRYPIRLRIARGDDGQWRIVGQRGRALFEP